MGAGCKQSSDPFVIGVTARGVGGLFESLLWALRPPTPPPPTPVTELRVVRDHGSGNPKPKRVRGLGFGKPPKPETGSGFRVKPQSPKTRVFKTESA